MKKKEWKKPDLQVLSDSEFINLFESVAIVDDYLNLFKSCSNVFSRAYVIRNAENQLESEQLVVFFKFCCDYLMESYEKVYTLYLDKAENQTKNIDIPDEGFIY